VGDPAGRCMLHRSDHASFKPKPNAYSMCAQESGLDAYRTENGYRKTSVTIYNIFTK
jgi:hypothetical protein